MSKMEQLITDFPRLFREATGDDYSIVRQWGIQCGDGWHDLVRQLCHDIERVATEAGLDPDSEDWPRVVQIKEKFGTLRFYIRTPADIDDEQPSDMVAESGPGRMISFRPVAGMSKIRELVMEAEQRSGTLCEHCGAPGNRHMDGWVRTLCELCEARYNKKS